MTPTPTLAPVPAAAPGRPVFTPLPADPAELTAEHAQAVIRDVSAVWQVVGTRPALSA